MATYVFSDLHGNYNLWKQIQNYIKEDDKVFCLGDNCDRGKNGIKIIQEILKDNRFIYLQGNHEKMLIDAINKSKYNGNISFRMFDNIDIQILKHNGTFPTLQEFQLLSKEERDYIVENLSKLPICAFTSGKDGCSIFLSHAGCHPPMLNELNKEESKFNLIWDRKHIAKEVFHYIGNNELYIVHGHTPVQTLGFYNKQLKNYDKAEIVYYCEGHKIDLDICTPESHKIALFNLSTFEVIYFEDEIKTN